MYRIRTIGKQKNSRLKSISIIKNELGYCMKSAKDHLDTLLNGNLDFEIDSYQRKVYNSIFKNIEYEEIEDIMDLNSIKYQLLEEQQHKDAHVWFDSLEEYEQEYVRTLQSEMIPRAN